MVILRPVCQKQTTKNPSETINQVSYHSRDVSSLWGTAECLFTHLHLHTLSLQGLALFILWFVVCPSPRQAHITSPLPLLMIPSLTLQAVNKPRFVQFQANSWQHSPEKDQQRHKNGSCPQEEEVLSQTQRFMPVLSTVRKLRQGDCHEFEVSLEYRVRPCLENWERKKRTRVGDVRRGGEGGEGEGREGKGQEREMLRNVST